MTEIDEAEDDRQERYDDGERHHLGPRFVAEEMARTMPILQSPS